MMYLLISRGNGGFWRPNSSGYTDCILQAGLYDQARADEINSMDHSYAVPFDEKQVERARSFWKSVNKDILEAVISET